MKTRPFYSQIKLEAIVPAPLLEPVCFWPSIDGEKDDIKRFNRTYESWFLRRLARPGETAQCC